MEAVVNAASDLIFVHLSDLNFYQIKPQRLDNIQKATLMGVKPF